ncbi:MAG: hypothetical protein ACRERU_04865 [Methylococcales bacterium]
MKKEHLRLFGKYADHIDSRAEHFEMAGGAVIGFAVGFGIGSGG